MQQSLNDPVQLAFSSLPSAGTFVREMSSFLAPALTPAPKNHKAATGESTTTTGHTAGAADEPESIGVAAELQQSSAAASSNVAINSMWPSLPANVHVLSLQWQSCTKLLVRLVNTFQAGELAGSQPEQATVQSLWSLFNWASPVAGAGAGVESPHTAASRHVAAMDMKQQQHGITHSSSVPPAWAPDFVVTDIREVTLFGGQRPLHEQDLQPVSRWPLGEHITKWEPSLWPSVVPANISTSTASTRGASGTSTAHPGGPYSFLSNRIVGPVRADVDITLAPMQIRSFVVTVHRGSKHGSWDFGLYGPVEPCSAFEEGPGPASKAAPLAEGGGASAADAEHGGLHTHVAGVRHALDAGATRTGVEQDPRTFTGLVAVLRHRHAAWREASHPEASEHAGDVMSSNLPPPLWLFDLMLLWPLGLLFLLVASLTVPGVKRSRRSSTGLQHRKSTTGWQHNPLQP